MPSVWASGSHVWNGHIGTLIANPRAIALNTINWNVCVKPPAAPNSVSLTRSNVRIRAAEVQREEPQQHEHGAEEGVEEELDAAYSRFADPQIPSGSTRNEDHLPEHEEQIRSNAMNVPAIPVSRSSISARKASCDPIRYEPPRVDRTEERQQEREDVERHRDAVDADVEARPDRGDPVDVEDELQPVRP